MSQQKKDPVLADFRNFLFLAWHHIGLPDPTPVQYDIGHYLQHGPRRKIIQAFRGVGKSFITSAYVVWRLKNNPDLKFLVVSAAKDRADMFSTFTARLIREMDILQELKPRRGQRNSNIAMDVGPAANDHSPSIRSVGVTGQLTGSRADEVIADDVEAPTNSLTQTQRDRLSEIVKEFDAILKPEGSITYLGTPQTEMSLYNVLPDRGYHIRIWPARYPTHQQMESYGHRLAPWIRQQREQDDSLEWSPVDPQRFNEEDLREREASWGRSGFALQYMLDTSLSDANKFPLKLGDLIAADLNPEIGPRKIVWGSGPDQQDERLPNVGLTGDRWFRPLFMSSEWDAYEGVVMAVDPAGRGEDETGYSVVALLNGMLFCLECSGLSGGYSDDTLERLAKVAKHYKVNKVLVEDNFGDGMFTQLLKPHLRQHHAVGVEEVRNHAQKERRIIADLEPVMNQHRLVMNTSVIRDDAQTENPHFQLFHQMTRLTAEKGALAHDDRLEALQLGVYYWWRAMAQDEEERVQESYEEELDEMLEQFLEHTLDRPPKKDKRWAPI